jgi:hypothetical protein
MSCVLYVRWSDNLIPFLIHKLIFFFFFNFNSSFQDCNTILCHASFAALAVLLDFLLQVTAFVAFIVFDFLRAEDKRIDCIPCQKISSSSADSDKGSVRRLFITHI